MFRRIAMIGHPFGLLDLSVSFLKSLKRTAIGSFSADLARYCGLSFSSLSSSGAASFYLILTVLKGMSDRREVILPAYTASSLVVAIKKAGLVPVLCDISLSDFNADINDLLAKVNEKTLCVLAVHMFGIPWGSVRGLKERLGSNVFVVEDCAQSFGSRIHGMMVGNFSDCAFYSFNRGKNLPLYKGGCMVTSNEEIAKAFQFQVDSLQPPSLKVQWEEGIKLSALYLAFRPFFYALLYPLIRVFKENLAFQDFDVRSMVPLQAAFGARLLKKSPEILEQRFFNALYLIDGLRRVKGLRLPVWSKESHPIFNRLPVLVEDPVRLDRIQKDLEKSGIESSRFYLKPLHHIFDLGYSPEAFPQATFLAERLLTIPVHPFLERRDLRLILKILSKRS